MDLLNDFIQKQSPDRALNHAAQGGFLQSEEWRKFQEAVGRKTYSITGENFYASVIKHSLPIVGSYFYIPRGPIIQVQSSKFKVQSFFDKIISLAKKENAGWIRIEPKNTEILEIIRNIIEINRNTAEISRNKLKITKAPHDVQPREILVLDITKPEEELLAEMKPKTRYNIKLSQKHRVSVKVISNFQFPISNKFSNSNDQNPKFYIDKFIELVKVTAERDGITPHPESYYRKMFETISPDILKLYAAEYEGKVIAANLVIFYGKTAIYLHGTSDNEYRNVMAPYLLQWQAILDAKKAGCYFYDLGGVKISSKYKEESIKQNNWAGITKFKTGFAPNIAPIVFPGSYDIIFHSRKYLIYKILQKVKNMARSGR